MLRRERKLTNISAHVPRRRFGFTTRDDGIVVVEMPRWHIPWMQKHLVPRFKSPFIRITLDRFGSRCWLLMDGAATAGELAVQLEREFGEEIRPVHERLGRFLTQLRQRGFIELLPREGS
jgi:hypothetical protein